MQGMVRQSPCEEQLDTQMFESQKETATVFS